MVNSTEMKKMRKKSDAAMAGWRQEDTMDDTS